ncbi:hypothetical protein [Mucilaginibacter aquaedulcis]|uniref:hypothetical protein n=1 Tax=Mucilaginibacter aquaedulcis TaxID=1187081 RepID=UPI0025B4DE0A|nr:hypothetical protein [Mucilaginibacter aquaedulcis]MDN3549853.1 hypothetical protein [Mucilaginibacter aquaedulcis]
MKKPLLFLLLIVVYSTCSKKTYQSAAPCNPGMCTMMFATVGVNFVDKAGNAVAIKDFKAVNLRSSKVIQTEATPASGENSGFHVIATDGNIKEFTIEGDEVKVTATNAATNQTQSITVKITGGCACHVAKVAGPDKVVFD